MSYFSYLFKYDSHVVQYKLIFDMDMRNKPILLMLY